MINNLIIYCHRFLGNLSIAHPTVLLPILDPLGITTLWWYALQRCVAYNSEKYVRPNEFAPHKLWSLCECLMWSFYLLFLPSLSPALRLNVPTRSSDGRIVYLRWTKDAGDPESLYFQVTCGALDLISRPIRMQASDLGGSFEEDPKLVFDSIKLWFSDTESNAGHRYRWWIVGYTRFPTWRESRFLERTTILTHLDTRLENSIAQSDVFRSLAVGIPPTLYESFQDSWVISNSLIFIN